MNINKKEIEKAEKVLNQVMLKVVKFREQFKQKYLKAKSDNNSNQLLWEYNFKIVNKEQAKIKEINNGDIILTYGGSCNLIAIDVFTFSNDKLLLSKSNLIFKIDNLKYLYSLKKDSINREKIEYKIIKIKEDKPLWSVEKELNYDGITVFRIIHQNIETNFPDQKYLIHYKVFEDKFNDEYIKHDEEIPFDEKNIIRLENPHRTITDKEKIDEIKIEDCSFLVDIGLLQYIPESEGSITIGTYTDDTTEPIDEWNKYLKQEYR